MADNIAGQMLREVQTGQCLEWKDIADHNPFYRSFWAWWNSLVVRDGMQECHSELTDGRTKTAKIERSEVSTGRAPW